jgi:hypothetical protein
MSEFELRRRLRNLGTNRDPQQDLWPAIAGRLGTQAAPRSRPGRLVPFAAAAGLVLALGAGTLAWTLHRQPAPVASADAGVAAGHPAAVRLDRVAGSDPRLAGAAVVLDAAHAELEQALEQDPGAVFLVGLINRNNAQRMRLARFALKAG